MLVGRCALAVGLAAALAGCTGSTPAPRSDLRQPSAGTSAGTASTGTASTGTASLGAPVPAFVVPDLSGHGTVGLSDFTGRPLLVNVFASWCGPCQQELPDLAAAARRYDGKVAFLGLDYEDDPAAGRAVLAWYGVSYRAGVDRQGETAARLGLPRGVPVTVLVSPDGRLVDTHPGPLLGADLDAEVHKLLPA